MISKLKRVLFPIVIIIWVVCNSSAQISYGYNKYVEYHQGTLPIIISVPHDGALVPSSIPDRTCGTPTLGTDLNTYVLGKQIDSAFVALTGCNIHMVYCNLRRTKLDCNRIISDAACGNKDAEQAWTDFHTFIEKASERVKSQYNNRGFYIDLHGHGHTVQQLELGYLYTAAELNQNDAFLNTEAMIAEGSIRYLVKNNNRNLSNAELLRGDFALGTLLGNEKFPSVPSKQVKSPGTNAYFNGGYSTTRHTSYNTAVTIDGVQVEANFTGVRDNFNNRKAFAKALAKTIVEYMNIHYGMNLSNCKLVNIYADANQELNYFPNPFSDEIVIDVKENHRLELFNGIGSLIKTQELFEGKNIIDTTELPIGSYIVKIGSKTSKLIKCYK